MTYTKRQITNYANLLAFTSSTEEVNSLASQNKQLGQVLDTFHIEITLLDCLNKMKQQKLKVGYLELRDFLAETVFGGDASIIELEKKLDLHLDQLISKKLLKRDLTLSKKGQFALAEKNSIFYLVEQTSKAVN